MLNRIKIEGYKTLRDIEVRFQPLSVLFGPNGAGKSNFLDALHLLSKIATCRTLKEAFDPPYRGKPLESFSFPRGGLKEQRAKESLSFRIEVDLTLSDAVVHAVNKQVAESRRPLESSPAARETEILQGPVRERSLRYRIEIEMLPQSGILRVADEYLAALNAKGEPTGKRKPFLSAHGGRLHLRQEGQAHPTYLDRYLDHSILSRPHYPPHYPHLVAARRELENWLFFYFEPRERMRAACPVKEVRHIGSMGEELPAYLNTLKVLEPKQFSAVEKALKIFLPEIEGVEVGVNDLGEVELKLAEGGVLVPTRVLSEGTLRLLGMLALAGAKEPPSLIGFEEPENGVHPGRIRLIADMLKNRSAPGKTQYIVTTHSPILPDMVSDESLFVVRKDQAATRIEPFTTWGPLGRRSDIDQALEEGQEHRLTVSERLLRGDFDA